MGECRSAGPGAVCPRSRSMFPERVPRDALMRGGIYAELAASALLIPCEATSLGDRSFDAYREGSPWGSTCRRCPRHLTGRRPTGHTG